MWHSEADVMKDLISLDDFGVSKTDEPYKILYSFGRGSNSQRKPKVSNSFIDPRSGDIIDVDDEVSQPTQSCSETKGRGSVINSFYRSKYQLQKQLRLARPFGSGDEAIESFCRRNRAAPEQETYKSKCDSDSDDIQFEAPAGSSHSPFSSLIEKMKPKVKATRNSKLQCNVLIRNLLSKEIIARGTAEEPNYQKADDCDDDLDDKGDSKPTSYSNGFDTNRSIYKTPESDIEKYNKGSGTHEKIGSVSTWEKTKQEKDLAFANGSGVQLKECEKEYQRKHGPKVMANFSNLDKQTNNRMYDFEECLKNLTSTTENSSGEIEHFFGSTSADFVVDNKDFPPLSRN